MSNLVTSMEFGEGQGMTGHHPLPRQGVSDQVKLIGLDFGSTTSSAIVARAKVGCNCVTGRMELGHPEIIYRSTPVFTPISDGMIDEHRIAAYIDQWIVESGVCLDEIFSGGAIITGLAALRRNAQALSRLVVERVGDAIIATADDPSLESWLAFMGSSSVLSRFHSSVPLINLDIGGGTTNPALGLAGNVLETGSYYVGARHFRFDPGSYRLLEVSDFGMQLLAYLNVDAQIGNLLCLHARDQILDFYIEALEAIVTCSPNFFDGGMGKVHEQVRFDWKSSGTLPVATYSGGVGELVYRHAAGEPLPTTTYYGDLGIDLARRIVASPVLAAGLSTMVPKNRGRATVYGLALHSTAVSGTSLYLPDSKILPLRDIPIVVRLPLNASLDEWCKAFDYFHEGNSVVCVQVISDPSRDGKGTPFLLEEIKAAGQCLSLLLQRDRLAEDQTLVLVVSDNIGKTLGNYATQWGKVSGSLIVIDEIPDRQAHFVNIGRCLNNVVPVSFYGMN